MIDIVGRRIESSPDEIIIRKPDGSYAFPRKISKLVTEASITPVEYALVQEGDKASSAISMKQRFNGKNHLDTNVEVLTKGLVVPRAPKFVTQIINVNRALNLEGVLYDANGCLIEGQKLKDYAYIVNHNCLVWLNESFEKDEKKEGFLDLSVVYIAGLENGKPVFEREPLQPCLEEDCYADLQSVSNQGFPTKKSPIQKYEPGKSAYFWHPRPNRAVGFGAGPGDAGFVCLWGPQGTDVRLGVFDCAEGADAEKSKE